MSGPFSLTPSGLVLIYAQLTRIEPTSSSCGTVVQGRYIIRVTGDSNFPSTTPGYLYTDPSSTFGTGQPYAMITTDITLAHVYTLESASGCTVGDIAAGSILQAAPAALGSGSVVISRTATSDTRFVPYQCSSSTTGGLACRISNPSTNGQIALTNFAYLVKRSGSLVVSFRYPALNDPSSPLIECSIFTTERSPWCMRYWFYQVSE